MAPWYRQDEFLNPKKPANFAKPEPGKIGGADPGAKTMADPPEPKVIEIEGTDETDVERTETAKPKAGTVNPVATDEEMYKVNYPSNFRASQEDSHEIVFIEPADRGPRVIQDDEAAENPLREMDGESVK